MEKKTIRFNPQDLIFFSLMVVTIALLVLNFNANANLGRMIELYKDNCYIAPNPVTAANVSRQLINISIL